MKNSFIKRYKDKPLYKDKNYLLVLAVFLLIFGIIGYTLFVDANSIDLKKKTSFHGTIEKTFHQKSSYYLKFSNRENWVKLKNFRNKSYPELDFNFMDIIEKGDLLSKEVNSDTIKLIRAEKTYSFLIEKYFK